jgi:AcrR family transcriptional regulator
MGRKSAIKTRKPITKKVNLWLGDLLLCLQNENIEDLSIDDLARLAGKSKSTLYEYFESKEAVLLAACETKTKALTERIVSVNKEKINRVVLYEQLVAIAAEGTANISISFLQSIKLHYPKSWLVIEKFTDLFVDLLKIQYSQGITEGIYHPISVELLGHLDKLFVTQVVTNKLMFTDKDYTLSKLITDYLNLRLKGLLKK